MCKVSNKIKFCTCKAASVESLKHYWVFYKYAKDKNMMILGEAAMPYTMDPSTHIFNTTLLLQRVNEPGAFDVLLHPATRDRLQVSFLCGEGEASYFHYGFEYKKGRWLEKIFNYFEWNDKHDEASFGVCQKALLKTTSRS